MAATTAGKRRLLLLSNSSIHGGAFLEWATQDIVAFLARSEVKKVTFIPYALRDHDGYAAKVGAAFNKMGFEFESIHKYENPVEVAKKSGAFFVGGGNTFQLLKSLYDKNLIMVLRSRVLQDGVPYIGSSAGTNVSTASICTTNDMPIVYPPSFEALKLINFNINPHYIDPVEGSKHMGETRPERINQYHEIPGMPPVLGLREGSFLNVEGNVAKIGGLLPARLFQPDKDAVELEKGSDVSFLL